MKRWERWMLAVPALILCVAATQWAMRGTHQPSGNVGYLGTEIAGVEGTTTDPASEAIRGSNTASGAVGSLGRVNNGVYGLGVSTGAGVYGNGFFGVEGTTLDANGAGVSGSGPNNGVRGIATGTGNGQAGVYGAGVYGVSGLSTSTEAGSAGVRGDGLKVGLWGHATANTSDAVGVYADGEGMGVNAVSVTGFAVKGFTTEGTGIYGVLFLGGGGHAGYFEGRVHVNGTLSKSAGSFKIDHPLDPGGKYLSHSFVESSDMKNIYDGVVTLSDNGTAIVELPEWFEALNKDFRYQLTCIGEHAPVYVAEEIVENRFRIAGGYAGMKVSWQVTGSRQDAYAKAYPIPVEEPKPAHEMGRFLHPELYQAPAGLRIGPSRVER